jgi:hypothetical protein
LPIPRDGAAHAQSWDILPNKEHKTMLTRTFETIAIDCQPLTAIDLQTAQGGADRITPPPPGPDWCPWVVEKKRRDWQLRWDQHGT